MGIKLPDQKWFITTQLDANRVVLAMEGGGRCRPECWQWRCVGGIFALVFTVRYFTILLYTYITVLNGKGQVKDKAKVSRSYFNTSYLTFVQPRT